MGDVGGGGGDAVFPDAQIGHHRGEGWTAGWGGAEHPRGRSDSGGWRVGEVTRSGSWALCWPGAFPGVSAGWATVGESRD